MSPSTCTGVAVIGGGPAGLMAAEALVRAGLRVDLYEAKGSVGRKFLLAGKGGLNLTHAEPLPDFKARYRERQGEVGHWLDAFRPGDLRAWARNLGVETFAGTSDRVFPRDLKAAPLLRAWVRRLRTQGLHFHMNHRLRGLAFHGEGALQLELASPQGALSLQPQAAILALGGGSWPQLGSDGAWVEWLRAAGVDVAPLQASNGGFELDWSPVFAQRYAGQAVKPVRMDWMGADGQTQSRQGEFIVTTLGVEGSLVYAASADLRQQINRQGSALVHLDLVPGRDVAWIRGALARPRNGRSLGEHLRRSLRVEGVRAGLLFELASAEDRSDPARLAAQIKHLPLRLARPRPIAEAISSAGGVRLEALTPDLMLRAHPGLFCAGEMLDWEAPTGGYLLSACFASGKLAGEAALRWCAQTHPLSSGSTPAS